MVVLHSADKVGVLFPFDIRGALWQQAIEDNSKILVAEVGQGRQVGDGVCGSVGENVGGV